jgi:hypothetical protein
MEGRKLLICAPVVPVAATGTTTTDGACGSPVPAGPTAARKPIASTAPNPTDDSPVTTRDFMAIFLW